MHAFKFNIWESIVDKYPDRNLPERFLALTFDM